MAGGRAAARGLPAALDSLADMRALPHRGITIHTDRLVYAVSVRGGTLVDRVGRPTDLARWHTLAEAERLRLRPFTAAALGLSAFRAGSMVDAGLLVALAMAFAAGLGVPQWLLDALFERVDVQNSLPPPGMKVCRGRIFSPRDYQVDVGEWGFSEPVGNLEEQYQEQH